MSLLGQHVFFSATHGDVNQLIHNETGKPLPLFISYIGMSKGCAKYSNRLLNKAEQSAI
jgi:hypothetical protein